MTFAQPLRRRATAARAPMVKERSRFGEREGNRDDAMAHLYAISRLEFVQHASSSDVA